MFLSLPISASDGPRRGALGVQPVLRDGVGNDRQLDRSVVCQGLQRGDRDVVAIDLEEAPELDAVAALKALADDGAIKPSVVADAIAKYGLDTERAAPWTV